MTGVAVSGRYGAGLPGPGALPDAGRPTKDWLRVCIDARPARNVVTGLGTYARHLVPHLARRGRLRAAQLTWERAAQQTLEVYTQVGGHRSRGATL